MPSLSGRKINWRFWSLPPEDKLRLLSYLFAVGWPIAFLLVQPSTYSIISNIIIGVWMSVAAVGGVVAALGVLSGIDLKMELPGIYFILMGPVLYFFAQVGFIFAGEFQNRFALSIFVLWHISLMLPRIVSLETFRRRERLRQQGQVL